MVNCGALLHPIGKHAIDGFAWNRKYVPRGPNYYSTLDMIGIVRYLLYALYKSKVGLLERRSETVREPILKRTSLRRPRQGHI